MSVAAARPLISVYEANGNKGQSTIALPAVFTAPIRSDIVAMVHTGLAKNKRQAYAVSTKAGHQTSAESWGTGRAVARIPRVSGGGTPRSGQGAFGNMCRGGRMFAPTKVWRRWHVRVGLKMRRAAVAAAIAASAVPALVMARGHAVAKIPEIPLVVSSAKFAAGDDGAAAPVPRTRDAKMLLEKINAYDDVRKVALSKTMRAGKGKLRNRRFRMRRGPLVVYAKANALVKAFRNLPGVELCCVTRLNLLQLAPGGHLGRFVIWMDDAFAALDSVFGSHVDAGASAAAASRAAVFPRAAMANPDLTRILTSEGVKAALIAAGPRRTKRPFTQKKNPLRNRSIMMRLNPYAKALKSIMKQTNGGSKKPAKGPSASGKRGKASSEFVKQLLSTTA